MEKPEAQTFDLSQLEQDDTTTIEIMHPVFGDPLPGVTATIYGQDSEQFQAAARKAETKYTEYARRNRGKVPPEYREQLDRDKIAACTKSIDGLSLKGEPLTDVADIFKRYRFIYEQVVVGITDRANFIKSSSAK